MGDIETTANDLAIQINAEHEACIGAAGTAVEHAIKVGRLLFEAKNQVPYGGWMAWVKENCRFSQDTAGNYMRVARFRACSKFEGHKPESIRQALAMLSAPTEEADEPIDGPILFGSNGEPDVIEKETCDKKSESKAEQKTKSKAEATPIPWTESELERREQAEQGITVIANISHDHQLIAWAQNERRFIKIDRTTPFGNPMKLDWMGNDRDAVINWYLEHWLPFVADHLPIDSLLGGKVLGCWCYPEACHGHVIVDFISQHPMMRNVGREA